MMHKIFKNFKTIPKASYISSRADVMIALRKIILIKRYPSLEYRKKYDNDA